MRLSDERINYLAHHIVKTLKKDGVINVSDTAVTAQEVKKSVIKFMQTEHSIDEKVRTKISTLKRGVFEGSHEWEILYEQYYNEEMNKLVR